MPNACKSGRVNPEILWGRAGPGADEPRMSEDERRISRRIQAMSPLRATECNARIFLLDLRILFSSPTTATMGDTAGLHKTHRCIVAVVLPRNARRSPVLLGAHVVRISHVAPEPFRIRDALHGGRCNSLGRCVRLVVDRCLSIDYRLVGSYGWQPSRIVTLCLKPSLLCNASVVELPPSASRAPQGRADETVAFRPAYRMVR
jgi:hypothetical protein